MTSEHAFQPGNVRNLSHGIWSDRKVDPIALEYAEGLIDKRPDLLDYGATVVAWARAEARCQLLSEWLASHDLVDDEGNVAPVGRFITQFENLAAKLREQLGLTPKSEADLATSRAQATQSSYDLAELQKVGRQIRERRELERA